MNDNQTLGWIIKWKSAPGIPTIYPYKADTTWVKELAHATRYREVVARKIVSDWPCSIERDGFGPYAVKLVKKPKVKQPEDGLTDNYIAFLIETALADPDDDSAFSTELFFECLDKLSGMGLIHKAYGLIADDRCAYAYITSKGKQALLNRFKPVELNGVQSDTCNKPR